MAGLDETHDPARRSRVASANAAGTDFPIQNLPFGIFSPPDGEPRGGVAIGDRIFDLAVALEAGLFSGDGAEAARAAAGSVLNPLMALGREPRVALRRQVSDLLDACNPAIDKVAGLEKHLLKAASACTLHLPASVGDYTDFYAGIQHATNAGSLFGREPPLPPNYKFLPLGYHGRASSVRPSGVPIRRPNGQRKRGVDAMPSFGPSRNLDYELELGIWIGPGNALGEPVPIAEAADHVVGYCLLNDWSARDIQGWEYQPLGPFLGKSFATTISPWIVTTEALAPFRVPQAPRPEQDPRPMDYLWDVGDQGEGALDIALEALLATEGLKAKGLPPHPMTRTTTRALYWTVAQLVAHHSSNGCDLRPGDLFGSGTVSGATRDSFGSLLELTRGGKQPIELASGETRRFLEDGDEVAFRAHCARDGFVPIGFGDCGGRIVPALHRS